MTTATRPGTRRSSGRRLAAAIVRGDGDRRLDRLFTRRPALAPRALADWLLDRSRDQLRADARASLVLAQAAGRIAARLNDRHRLGQSYRATGNALAASGSVREAVRLHEQAACVFLKTDDERELARTLNALIHPLILLGQYDRAVEAAGRARELFAAHGDELRLAKLDINVGNLLHRQDRFDEALACYERAHAGLLRLNDTDSLIAALHNKAVTLTALNDFHRALDAYEAARRLSVERKLPRAVAQTDYNIAWLYYLRGDYRRALELLRAAAVVARDNGDAYHEALSLLDLSAIYLELNLSGEARTLADDARARFQQLGMGYEAAKALVWAAIAEGQNGSADWALDLFGRARAELVAEKNQIWPPLIDLYRAILLFTQGDLAGARDLCGASLEFFATTNLRKKTALCRLLLARVELRLGRFDEARRQCELVLDPATGPPIPILGYHARAVLGHVELESGCHARAYASYQAARESLEALRGQVPGEELKMAFVNDRLEVYERLIRICLDKPDAAGRGAEILSYVEHAKSRALLDLMAHPVHALARADADESELSRSLREIRRDISWYYHRIEREQLQAGEHCAAQVEALEGELAAREREFARLLHQIEQSEPQRSDMERATVASVDAIAAALPDEALLVEYFELGGRFLACVLDRGCVSIVPLGDRAVVDLHVRMMRYQLAKLRLGAEYEAAFATALLNGIRFHLRALFDALLAPFGDSLAGRHLLIVPHGRLHAVPFHALFDGERYLIDRCSVSYAPSASIYTRCDARPAAAGNGALVMGLPDAQAPFIEAEARAVAEAMPGARLYLGEAATEDVLRRDGRSSRFVHIASHGHFRPRNPMFSALRLGDRYIDVYDLYSMSLPVELVTLSGCGTGANVMAAGDELLGITRGLFCAGARSLLVTLWDVHDESAAGFMKALYGRIAAGTPLVRALGDAMVELRAERPHPYYWAPFVLNGRFRREPHLARQET